jgi:hypothetical protein
MTKPSLLKKDIWGNHEKRVLTIFRLALEMLQKNQELPQSEDELNRKLCFFVRYANQQLTISNQGIEWPCMCEANNQPDAVDSIRAKR